jgi:hypothetical protein
MKKGREGTRKEGRDLVLVLATREGKLGTDDRLVQRPTM